MLDTEPPTFFSSSLDLNKRRNLRRKSRIKVLGDDLIEGSRRYSKIEKGRGGTRFRSRGIAAKSFSGWRSEPKSYDVGLNNIT